MNTLLVIIGPTGVGKTDVCMALARHFNIPVINADSRQMFAQLPIGTAAPTAEQQKAVRHYFVGNLPLDAYYSAAMYENDVMSLLDSYYKEGNTVALMSGGSMMYLDAVCHGIDDIPTVDAETRRHVMDMYNEKGLEPMLEKLEKLDPQYFATVDRQNPKRVIHALEICLMTGCTYTSFRKNERKQRPFRIVRIGLIRPREELYDRINRRVLAMQRQGLEEEARKVYPYRHLNALNTVGYKEMFEYFDGKMSLDEAIERIQGNTRKYCRKQLTWFKRDESIRWFNPDNIEEIIKYAANTL